MTDAPAVLVDANVLFDVLYDDPMWAEWSLRHLEDASLGPLAINDVIYAELSVRFPTIEALDKAIAEVGLLREQHYRTYFPTLALIAP